MTYARNTRIYAIGDIHGCADQLRALLAIVAADWEITGATDSSPTLLTLGDYIDRGPDTPAVMDLLLDGLPGFEQINLRGNHEELLFAWLGDGSVDDPEGHKELAFLRCGGLRTLRQYGISVANLADYYSRTAEVRAEAQARIPARHLGFLRASRLYHETEALFFAYAGVRPGVPLAENTVQDLLWIRSGFLDDRTPHPKLIVHGHTAEGPTVLPNRINLDSKCFGTGMLTCGVFASDSRRFRLLQVPG